MNDEQQALGSLRRLKALAGAVGAELVPGHDPDAWADLAARLGAPWPAARAPGPRP